MPFSNFSNRKSHRVNVERTATHRNQHKQQNSSEEQKSCSRRKKLRETGNFIEARFFWGFYTWIHSSSPSSAHFQALLKGTENQNFLIHFSKALKTNFSSGFRVFHSQHKFFSRIHRFFELEKVPTCYIEESSGGRRKTSEFSSKFKNWTKIEGFSLPQKKKIHEKLCFFKKFTSKPIPPCLFKELSGRRRKTPVFPLKMTNWTKIEGFSLPQQEKFMKSPVSSKNINQNQFPLACLKNLVGNGEKCRFLLQKSEKNPHGILKNPKWKNSQKSGFQPKYFTSHWLVWRIKWEKEKDSSCCFKNQQLKENHEILTSPTQKIPKSWLVDLLASGPLFLHFHFFTPFSSFPSWVSSTAASPVGNSRKLVMRS